MIIPIVLIALILLTILIIGIVLIINNNNENNSDLYETAGLQETPFYLINLDKRYDRLYITLKNLELYGYNNVKRFPAVDSSKFTKEDIIKITQPDARESIFRNYRTHEEQLSIGAVGCYMSHYKLWKKMIDEKYDKIVVFEDDTLPTIYKKDIANYVSQIPDDWDVILLGGQYLTGWHLFKNIYKIEHFFCTHAYIIRNTKAVKEMVETALPMRKQIDFYMGDLSQEKKINIYGIMHEPHWGQNDIIGNTDVQIPHIQNPNQKPNPN